MKPIGVQHVMHCFSQAYLGAKGGVKDSAEVSAQARSTADSNTSGIISGLLCEEDRLVD